MFDIHPTSSYGLTNAKLFETKGNVPVVVNSSLSNGIGGFVDLKPTENGNMITYSDTTTSEAIFYQPNDFIGYSHVQGLYPFNPELWNEKRYIYFLITFKKSASGRFDYANKFNREIAKEINVSLPTTKDNKIAFDYMEAYIRELEEERIRELEEERIRELAAYLKVSGLENYTLTDKERIAIERFNSSSVRFGEFRIGDIFNIYTGRDVIIGRTDTGNTPLVSHQNTNNGIVKYIAPLANRIVFDYSKTIALADRGLFYATTQDNNFYIGTRVKALEFKQGMVDEKIRLFFTTAINKLQILFTEYSSNATDKLPTLSITLPITESGTIDYDFMETYISAIQKLVIKNVVLWKDKVIKTTREVVG